mmetsp:Transcript_2744/g.7520  ORF Transcript_2744/g.7520 Transcript_2744/m.7520 type:complete len:88 (+) Transcript_2744:59-322(+)
MAAARGGENFGRYLSRTIFGSGGFWGFMEKPARQLAQDSIKPLFATMAFLTVIGYMTEHSHLKHEVEHAKLEREAIPPMPTEKDIHM